MMADHWKTIANALGAPGVDEPEVEAEPIASEAKPEPAPRSPHAQFSQESNKPSADRQVSPRNQDTDSSTEPASADARRGLDNLSPGFVFDPNVPIPDEALSFKSTKFRRTTPQTTPAAGSFSEPPTPAAEARREAPRMPDRIEPTSAPTAASPPPKPAKRKSSWESLASMFNIKVDRSKPAEVEEVRPQPTEPPTPAAAPNLRDSERPSRSSSTRHESDQQLSIFSGGQSTTAPNAALRSMFGDVPQSTNESWGKPRMVDDLGWDDEEVKPTSTTHSTAKPSFQSSQPAADEEAGEETVRRGRRRRRGRRGRGDSLETTAPASEKTEHWGEAEEVASSVDDDWPEPECFEEVESEVSPARAERELDSEFDAEADELSSEGEPLRRSSRRRRRGGRGREREPVDGSESVPRDRQPPRARVAPPAAIEDEDDDGVGFVPEVDDEDDFDGDIAGETPRRNAAGEEDRNTRSRRRRRGRGGSGRGREEGSGDDQAARPQGSAARPHSSATRPQGPPEMQRAARSGRPSEDDDFDADIEPIAGFEGEEDDAGSDGKQHRNIPTWADSIESLVSANMENRKRGDNRGAPRGRPKGRR